MLLVMSNILCCIVGYGYSSCCMVPIIFIQFVSESASADISLKCIILIFIYYHKKNLTHSHSLKLVQTKFI